MLKLANFSSFKSLTDFLCPNVCNNQGLDSTVLALDLLVQSIPIKLENTIVLSYVVLYITVVQYDPTKHLLYDVKEEEYRRSLQLFLTWARKLSFSPLLTIFQESIDATACLSRRNTQASLKYIF